VVKGSCWDPSVIGIIVLAPGWCVVWSVSVYWRGSSGALLVELQ
jgi:hypothetical protein